MRFDPDLHQRQAVPAKTYRPTALPELSITADRRWPLVDRLSAGQSWDCQGHGMTLISRSKC
jgi:hypothetical protein